MKINLSKFKKIKEDEHSTTLRHPAGHEITVAHRGISKDMHEGLKSLPHFDYGGAVDQHSNVELDKNSPMSKVKESYKRATEPYVPASPSNPVTSHPTKSQADATARADADYAKDHPVMQGQDTGIDKESEGGEIKQSNPKLEESKKLPHYADGTPDGPVSQDDQPSLAEILGQKARALGGKAYDIVQTGASDAADAFKNVAAPVGNFIKGAVQGAPTPSPVDPNAQNSSSQPVDQAFTPPPDASVQSPDTSPERPLATGPDQPPSPPQSSSQPPDQPSVGTPPTLQNAYQEQIAGAEGQSNALQGMYKNQAAIQQKAAADQQTIANNYQQNLKSLQDERDSLTQDIKDTHIDPNRIYSNMDTGSKIGSVLGLVAGGLGGAMTGQGGNAALDYLNKLSDKDIDAQKANLGKKESLLSANLKKFGDLQQATVMTKIMQADHVSSLLAANAAKAQSPVEAARLLSLKGQIDQGMAPAFQSLAMRQTLMSGAAKDTDPASWVPFLVPPDKQAAVTGEISHAWETRKAKDVVLNAFDQAVKDTSGLGAATSLVKEPRSIGALHAALGPTFNNIEHTVRQAAMDNMFGTTTPNRYDTKADTKTKRDALINYIQSNSVSPMAKAYNIDLDKFKSTSVAGPSDSPQYKTVNGVKYMRGPNGEAVKVQ